MLTRSQIDKQAAGQALKAPADGSPLAAALTGGTGGLGGMLRREVSPGPQDRPDGRAAAGMSPLEIQRELQVRQVAGIVSAPIPGPEAWADLELPPLPGSREPGPGRVAKGEPLTPAHAAAEAAVSAEEPEEPGRRRDRIRHLADPYSEPAEIPEVDVAELGKRYRQASDVPDGYPQPRQVDPEEFRRPPVTAGQAAYSPAYQEPARPVPVPSGVLSPGMATRPLIADGQSRPCAPEAC